MQRRRLTSARRISWRWRHAAAAVVAPLLMAQNRSEQEAAAEQFHVRVAGIPPTACAQFGHLHAHPVHFAICSTALAMSRRQGRLSASRPFQTVHDRRLFPNQFTVLVCVDCRDTTGPSCSPLDI